MERDHRDQVRLRVQRYPMSLNLSRVLLYVVTSYNILAGMMPTGSVFLDSPDGRHLPKYHVRSPHQGKPQAQEQALSRKNSSPTDLFHSILQCNRLPLPYQPPGTQSFAKKKVTRPESKPVAPAYNTQWDDSSEEEGLVPHVEDMDMRQHPQEHDGRGEGVRQSRIPKRAYSRDEHVRCSAMSAASNVRASHNFMLVHVS